MTSANDTTAVGTFDHKAHHAVVAETADKVLLNLAGYLNGRAYQIADLLLFADEAEGQALLTELNEVVQDYKLVVAMLAAGETATVR